MIIPALPGSIWHYKSYRLHFLRHSSNVPVKEDSEAFTIIREANVLSELNRSTYSSAKSDTDRLRFFFGRGFCGKYHHDDEDSMERRTVLEGITAATLSALSPPALKRFTLGQHANVPVASDFQTTEIKTSDNTVFIRPYGQGPVLLMVHGFPRTSLMWRYVAPRLAKNYAVICVDLRGYGRSGIPASTEDHYPYTKRAMANELVEVMTKLGFPRFSVVGHDRGGRVSYRLALDHPEKVDRPSAFRAGYWHALWIYFAAPTLGMLVAAEVFLQARGGVGPYCAKLHHANNKRCIFQHGNRTAPIREFKEIGK